MFTLNTKWYTKVHWCRYTDRQHWCRYTDRQHWCRYTDRQHWCRYTDRQHWCRYTDRQHWCRYSDEWQYFGITHTTRLVAHQVVWQDLCLQCSRTELRFPRRVRNLHCYHMTWAKHWWAQCVTLAASLPPLIETLSQNPNAGATIQSDPSWETIHSWSRAFMKIYGTFDKEVVKQCQFYTGTLTIKH